MRLRRLKKYAPHIIILAALIGLTVPTLGAHLLDELTPTINLIDVMGKPESVNLETMQIVDKSYDKEAVEYVRSITNDEINVAYPIWDIEGIYPVSQYGVKGATNYFNPSVFIHEETIDLSLAPLPSYTYGNEPRSSVFGVSGNDTFTINQDADDAWHKNSLPTRVNSTSETLLLGGHRLVGRAAQRRVALRWELPLPQDSVILEAYINLTYHSETSYDGFTSKIYAFDQGSTADFSNIAEFIRWGRPLYAGPNWVFPSGITPNETLQSQDIKAPLQHVISRNDWEVNNNFGVSIRPTAGVTNGVEFLEFWSYNGSLTAGKPEYVPKLYVRYMKAQSTYPKGNPDVDQWVYTKYRIQSVLGVWNTSDHRFGNLYNESEGDSFGSYGSVSNENWIILSEPAYQNMTSLWVTYLSDKIPLVIEYTVREWTTVTWLLGLEFDNRGDDTIVVPRANLTLNYLEETLGEGWIDREYEIEDHSKQMVDAYLVMENDRITRTFVTAVLTGEPIEFTLDFEAYIVVEGPNDEPMLPIIYSIGLDFPFPSASRGPPPFIHSITRGSVGRNNNVTISVSASDEGTGISDRTYIYYSINGGASWDQALLTGGTWWNSYLGESLGLYYPIKSSIEPETYEGDIPGFPSGTQVLFKVYLEDYAANIDHVDKGNWVWSQTYSYIVPGAGELAEVTKQFNQKTEKEFFTKFLDYIEINGLILSNYLYLDNINSSALIPLLSEMAEFFYQKEIDSGYALAMILLHFDKGMDVMGDSGVSIGYLLNLFGVSYADLFTFLVDHAFYPTHLPPDVGVTDIAKDRFEEIRLIDQLDVPTIPLWKSSAMGTVQAETSNRLAINGQYIGTRSLNWSVSGPAILSANYTPLIQLFGNIDLSKNDKIVFYIDSNNHSRLNGNLAMTLIDGNNKTMNSTQIELDENAAGFQEIVIPIGEFTKEPGFDIANIHYINFTYNGTESVNVYFDYICAYSSSSYEIHDYIINDIKLRNTGARSIQDFILNEFQGMGYGEDMATGVPVYDPVMPDWTMTVMRQRVMPSYNFMHLMATNGTYNYIDGPGPNHHMVGAELLLEYVGVPDPYAKICELLGIEIVEPEEAFTKEEIYPYTQGLGMMMVYIPFGAVAALAIVLQVRRYLFKKKVSSVRKKYNKAVR